MVIPGHARSRHKYRGTSPTIERRMRIDQVETEKGQARNAFEDQGGSEEAIRRRIPESIQVSPMGGQHSASTKERWQGTNMCRLSGFEQSKLKG